MELWSLMATSILGFAIVRLDDGICILGKIVIKDVFDTYVSGALSGKRKNSK